MSSTPRPQTVAATESVETGSVETVSRPRRAATVVAVLVAGLIASLLAVASPAVAKNLPHRNAKETRIAYALKRVLNDERRAHGLTPLSMNSSLLRSARGHNTDMAHFDEMSHQLPGEAYFTTRIQRAGYDWTWAGENIAWNSKMTKAGVLELERMMFHEKAPYDPHRQNILGRHYRNVGIDVYLDHTHHKVWLTVDFGNRS